MQPIEFTLRAFRNGCAAWPQSVLSPHFFVSRIQSLKIPEHILAERSSDLVLAFACAEGDTASIRYFESNFLSGVPLYVTRFCLPPSTLDELQQRLRIKLLVGPPPCIASYRGTGPLAAWVRITAVREALDMVGTGAARQRAEISLLDLGVSDQDDPEFNTVKHIYRDRFKLALEQAIDALPPREKTVLRLSVVDSLNIDAIGKIYRVHRATVARWLVSIRLTVLCSFRERLDLPPRTSPSEVRSLIAVLYEDIHVSTVRILGAPQ